MPSTDTIYALTAIAAAVVASVAYIRHLRKEIRSDIARVHEEVHAELAQEPPKQELPYGTPVAKFHVKASILLVLVLKPLAPGSNSDNGEPQVLTIPTDATVDLLDPANPVQVVSDAPTGHTGNSGPVLFMPPTLLSVPPHLLHETVRDLLHTSLHEFLSQLVSSPYFFAPNHQAIASDRVDSAHVLLCLHPEFNTEGAEANSVRDVDGVLHERYAGQATKLLAYAMPFTQEQATYVSTLRAHVEPERLAAARMPVLPMRYDDEVDDSEGSDTYSPASGPIRAPKGTAKAAKTPPYPAPKRPQLAINRRKRRAVCKTLRQTTTFLTLLHNQTTISFLAQMALTTRDAVTPIA